MEIPSILEKTNEPRDHPSCSRFSLHGSLLSSTVERFFNILS